MVLVQNRLYGPHGEVPTNASLAATSSTSLQVTVESANPAVGGRAVYDNTRTVHDLSTIRIDSSPPRQHPAADRPCLVGWWAGSIWMRDCRRGYGSTGALGAHFPIAVMDVVPRPSGNIGTRPTGRPGCSIHRLDDRRAHPLGQWWIVSSTPMGVPSSRGCGPRQWPYRSTVGTGTFHDQLVLTGYLPPRHHPAPWPVGRIPRGHEIPPCRKPCSSWGTHCRSSVRTATMVGKRLPRSKRFRLTTGSSSMVLLGPKRWRQSTLRFGFAAARATRRRCGCPTLLLRMTVRSAPHHRHAGRGRCTG